MSKKYSKFITCLFCGLLAFLFAANALTPDKDFSEIENRSLAQRPKLTVKDLSIGNLLTDKGATSPTSSSPGTAGWRPRRGVSG